LRHAWPQPHGARLDDRVAVVIDGSGAVGREISVALGSLGATVVVQHRDAPSEARDVVGQVRAAGGTATITRANVNRSREVQRLFDRLLDELGRVDIVVHTPGVVFDKPIADTTEAEYDAVFDLSAKCAFLVVREAARRLASRGRIVVVTPSAGSARNGRRSVAEAAMAAIERLVAVVADELHGRHITVNAVCPGPLESSGYRPGELGPLVAFLVTSDAQPLTGQTLQVGALSG
jgi:3-oxoacyl-[acyl-carrier protein] reductase